MKKLAARDFEDLLQVRSTYMPINHQLTRSQCAIPVFEGLLDGQHDRQLMKLLYRTAEWHALAKLRMHTGQSLDLLEALTIEFGKLMRQFRDVTCSQFATMELPRETAARKRREAQKQKGLTSPSDYSLQAAPTTAPPSVTCTVPRSESAAGPESEGLDGTLSGGAFLSFLKT